MAFNSYSKQIAITFDDAPLGGSMLMSGEEKTAKIIKILHSNNVKDALFFVTTGNIADESSANRLKSYTNSGFHLAHHSHTHLSANKEELTNYLSDFDQATNVLNSYDRVLNFHRFPYLHYGSTSEKRKAIANHLLKHDYRIGYVTIDNFDWYINAKLINAVEQNLIIDLDRLGNLYVDTLWQGIEFYDNLARKYLGRSPKHVLLLHENETAALFLGKLIQHIRSKGWEIITPQEAYQDPISESYQAATYSFNKQGRVAAMLNELGIAKTELRHKSENTDYLDKQFEVYGVFSEKEDHSVVSANSIRYIMR